MRVSEASRTSESGQSGQWKRPLRLPFSVPASVQKWLGNTAEEDAVAQNGGLFPKPEASEYVNAIGQKLIKNLARESRRNFGYKFAIVNNKSPNAFVLPNGTVYVTVGLLRLLRNEAQLANVLGHEVSHVTEEHTVNQIFADYLFKGGASFLGKLGVYGKGKADQKEAKKRVFALLSSGYSRDQEREADEVGQTLAAKAGWDPSGMTDVMSIFEALERDLPKEATEEYVRSHPYAAERIASAAARSKSLPRGELGVERYQQFLRQYLGVAPDETAKAPTEAAMDWMHSPPPAFHAPLTLKDYIVPGLIVTAGVGVLLYLLWRSR